MNSPKNRILILIDWFYPGYKAGGPIRSIFNLIQLINDIYDIYVLTTDTDHNEEKPYENIVADNWIYMKEIGAYVYYARRKNISNQQLENQIRAVQADYIYLNHLFSPRFVILPIVLKKFNKYNAKLIVCPRGALAKSALSHKVYKKKPLLFLYKIFKLKDIVTFHATNNKEHHEINNTFPGSKIHIINNLPNIQQSPFQIVKKDIGILKCIFISRIVDIKNLLFFLKVLESVQSETILTIIGPIEDTVYWAECKSQIDKLPNYINVIYLGSVPNTELRRYFLENHLFVLPTKGENFGHAIFESFLFGRPVLISDQTPWRSLNESKAGWDLPLNNEMMFKDIIEYLAYCDQEVYNVYANGAWHYAKNFISNSAIKENYINLFS